MPSYLFGLTYDFERNTNNPPNFEGSNLQNKIFVCLHIKKSIERSICRNKYTNKLNVCLNKRLGVMLYKPFLMLIFPAL